MKVINKLLKMIDKSSSDIHFYREGKTVVVSFSTYNRAGMFCAALNNVGDELYNANKVKKNVQKP